VTQPNTMSPRWDQRSNAVSDTEKAVKVKMVVKGVDYSTLVQNDRMRSQFVNRVKQTVANEAGEGIYMQHVSVELSSGSVVVDATINPPVYIDSKYLEDKLSSSETLQRSVLRNIQSIPNIDTARAGTIEVAEVQVLTPAIQAPPDSDDGEEKEDSKIVMVLGIAAGALGLISLVTCVMLFVMCKRTSANKNLEINGTTVAVGRPVQGNGVEPDNNANNAATGTPVMAKEDAKGVEP